MMSLNKSPPVQGMHAKAVMNTNVKCPRNGIAPEEGWRKEGIRDGKKELTDCEVHFTLGPDIFCYLSTS